MRIVTIGTGYASRVHFALQKGGIIVNLVALLAITVMEAWLDERGTEGVEETRDIRSVI